MASATTTNTSTPSATTARRPFWTRQFGPAPTPAQNAFDLAGGIILPIACVVLDPIVFHAPVGKGLIERYAVTGYLAIVAGVLTLALWLAFCQSICRLAPVFAGAFCANGLFALALGARLLPYSLLGLPELIGVLGLIPFLTAFVFWRNAVRALRLARSGETPVRQKIFACAAFLLVLLGPPATQLCFERQIAAYKELAISSDPKDSASGIAGLRRFERFVDLDEFVWAFEKEADPARRGRLSAAFHAVTDQDIQIRLGELHD